MLHQQLQMRLCCLCCTIDNTNLHNFHRTLSDSDYACDRCDTPLILSTTMNHISNVDMHRSISNVLTDHLTLLPPGTKKNRLKPFAGDTQLTLNRSNAPSRNFDLPVLAQMKNRNSKTTQCRPKMHDY